MLRLLLISISCLLYNSNLASAQSIGLPKWTNDGQVLRGSILQITCIGQGISLELARGEAIKSCQSTAALHFDDDVSIHTALIETEKDSAYHSEVRQTRNLKGLLCQPIDEHLRESDGNFKVWLRCKFDLSKVSVSSDAEIQREKPIETTQLLEHESEKSHPILPSGAYVRDKQTRLSIGTIPLCDSILIRGAKPRVIRCSNNPENLLLVPGDKELTIRKSGYKSKLINLNKAGYANDTSINIVFD